jgi:hypothetical protein
MTSSSVRLVGVLAHQGGWDEMLLVAGPIVVIVALLALAKRRVDGAAADAVSRYEETGQVRDGP